MEHSAPAHSEAERVSINLFKWRQKMSKKAFKEFCTKYIPTHPELGLKTDKMNPEEFAKVAVEKGPKAGFKFTTAEVDAVLGLHRETRRNVFDLGGSVKASVNGTAMCWQRGTIGTDPVEVDWLVIKGTIKRR
jgi:hypothetical protein